MTRTEKVFTACHSGKFAIRHAGILVLKAFETEAVAESWAKGNYRNQSNWTIVKLSKKGATAPDDDLLRLEIQKLLKVAFAVLEGATFAGTPILHLDGNKAHEDSVCTVNLRAMLSLKQAVQY